MEQIDKVTAYLDKIPQFMPLSGCERSKYMLKELGNPEKKLKIIHVAGTNGKGSVCSYLNAILCENGYKTGLFTSPHLVDIRERIRINNKMISKQRFVHAFNRVKEVSDRLESRGISLAYFDYLLGIAMCEFERENVDYVVMETGLGGKLDSTNAVDNPVLTVITTISLEHMAVLGDTVAKIAKEKAGIIKSQVPVVYVDKENDATEVIKNKALECGAKAVPVNKHQYQIVKNDGKCIDFLLHNEYYKNDCFLISTKAVYQVENCSLALTAAAVLSLLGKTALDEAKVRAAVYNMHWAGRMEEVLSNVYVDGAHNPEGIEAFIDSVRGISTGKCTLLFSVVKDKNFETMIKQLSECGLFSDFIVTSIKGSRQLSSESISETFAKYTNVPVREFESVEDAFLYACSHYTGVLMCTGSLYLVGSIKAIIESKMMR